MSDKPRARPPSKYDGLLGGLKIDERFTRRPGRPVYDRVDESLPPKEDYNFIADLLILPETKAGFRYLMVVMDLWTREFDAAPLKSKTPAETTQKLKKMFKRKYLSPPYASLRTDAGTEFRGEFSSYLKQLEVIHSRTVPGRHRQTGSIESLNSLLGRFLNGYLNRKERETGATYREWTDVLPQLVERLNKLRRREPEDPSTHAYGVVDVAKAKAAKFKVGDAVIAVLDKPQDGLGNRLGGETFRQGDFRWDHLNPRKIKHVVYYPRTGARYVLEGKTNVAYTEQELQLAPEQDGVQRQQVKKIVGKRKARGRVEYQVWFKGDKKADAVWLPLSQLKEDGLQDYVTAYNRS